jgi:hypothetical protein
LKLTRIRIEQFRQFRDAIEIDSLQDGINLFTGPNEAGKSTVVAAIRAAFFERYRSGAAEDFRPWGDAAASPTVMLDFEHGGQAYRLTKRFLARKRCELQVGPRMLDGAEAEEHLATLMGFEHAGKGASKADHWGIPGLLWIQQGSTQDMRESVRYATGHLRTALDGSLGEVASSHGDEVIAEVQAARDALLTPSTGKPKGAYATALDDSARLESTVSALQQEIAAYRQAVDTLAVLRHEHAQDAAEQPWAEFRAQEKAAAERLLGIKALQDALAMEQAQVGQWDSRVALLVAQRDTLDVEVQTAAMRQEALDRATQAVAAATALAAPWQSTLKDAEQALAAARERLQSARLQETYRHLARERDAVQARIAAVLDTVAQAEKEEARLIEHQREATASRIDEADLKRLLEVHLAVRDLELRLAGVGTRLRYALEAGVQIHIGKDAVAGSGERLLLDSTTLALPGQGTIEVVPGGTDLALLRREQDELLSRQQILLQRLGVPSLDAAQARQRTHAMHIAEARNAEATLKGLAPRGLEALRAELAGARARLAEIESTTPSPPASVDAAPGLSVEQAEATAVAAEQALRQATEGLHAAQLAARQAQVQAEAAQRERDAAQAVLDAAGRDTRSAEIERDLAHAMAQSDAARLRADALARQVAQARPDILEQDIERLRRSAEQHEKRHSERRDRLVRLEVELQAAGAQALEERHAELSRDLAQAQRQALELGRQARALDYLLGLLRERRNALTRQLQAPLRRCLQRYVELLFPQAQVDIDEDLMLGPLTRTGPDGARVSPFDGLSFGAREQMGLIGRLAYADLLREAGRPTLVILDDALVHTDDVRLAQMKRVLFDAGTRHQILLFTCHPAHWRDLGVAARPIGELAASRVS